MIVEPLFGQVLEELGRVAEKATAMGMHPSASGNISVEIKKLPWLRSRDAWTEIPLSEGVANLGGKYFLVTASGRRVGDLARDPRNAAGIIEISKNGKAFRKIWGFRNGGNPTSELPTHLLAQSAGTPGVVLHSHPPAVNAIMLTDLLKSSTDANIIIWQLSTEGVAYVPGGIAHLSWMVPGQEAIGQATANAFKSGVNAVLWDRHGIVVKGETVDKAWGSLETIEHAMDTTLRAATMGRPLRFLELDKLAALCEAFRGKVNAPNIEVWRDLSRAENDRKLASNGRD